MTAQFLPIHFLHKHDDKLYEQSENVHQEEDSGESQTVNHTVGCTGRHLLHACIPDGVYDREERDTEEEACMKHRTIVITLPPQRL